MSSTHLALRPAASYVGRSYHADWRRHRIEPTYHAWAAGIIDADGCITIKRQRRGEATYYSLQVIVSQVSAMGSLTDPPPVIRHLMPFGGNTSYQRPARLHRRPLWTWQVTGAKAEAFLRVIRPYLVGKADQADVAIDYRERAVGPPGYSNPAGRPIAEAAYLSLRTMKNYSLLEETG
jgi:hypothetical protein